MSDELEAAIAEAEGTRTVEAFGNTYPVAEKVGLMPLMKFAVLAKKGVDSADMAALEVMYRLIQSVIADEAWERFEEDATVARANDEDLLGVVQQAIAVISARPTSRPGDSSPGPQTTGASSTASSAWEARKRELGLVPVASLVG